MRSSLVHFKCSCKELPCADIHHILCMIITFELARHVCCTTYLPDIVYLVPEPLCPLDIPLALGCPLLLLCSLPLICRSCISSASCWAMTFCIRCSCYNSTYGLKQIYKQLGLTGSLQSYVWCWTHVKSSHTVRRLSWPSAINTRTHDYHIISQTSSSVLFWHHNFEACLSVF